MDATIEIAEGDGFLEARYLGAYSLKSYKAQMTESVQACLHRKIDRLLVDIISLAGYAPSTGDRYEIGKHGSEITGLIRVAVVGTPAQLADVFASRVAQNRGVSIGVFVEREKAVAWLKG